MTQMDELGEKMIFANIQNKGISRRPARKLTHAGLAKILLDRFAGIFSFTLVLCMLIFKITIILNAISSKIATRMMLIKENLLVVHTKKFVKFRAPTG